MLENGCLVIDGRELATHLPKRRPEGQKGDYGRILIVGGSSGLGGAPALAALGALRAGAGLVQVALPESLVCGPIAALAPEAMAQPIAERHGRMICNDLLTWLYTTKPFDVVAIGPGLGQNEETGEIVYSFLKINNRKLVLDADALNLIAAGPGGIGMIRDSGPGCHVLTPHPGEAARLLGRSVADVQADRLGAARDLARLSGGVAILKGHGTIVCQEDHEPVVCMAGNPGMASGGMGDVLAGIVAALWGQGLSAFDAAALGVWLHATAGDLVAAESCEESVVARDVANRLGGAFRVARSPRP